MRLDIGGGAIPAPGHVNVDPVHGDAGFKTMIQLGLHLDLTDLVDSQRASHVLEHVPSGRERVDAMNEVWRVLRPGGTFEIIVPCVGHTGHHDPERPGAPNFAGWQAWADPTHVSYWWFPESFWYFTGGPGGAFHAHADYGIRYWEEESMRLDDGWEAHVVLRKPK